MVVVGLPVILADVGRRSEALGVGSRLGFGPERLGAETVLAQAPLPLAEAWRLGNISFLLKRK